LFLKIAKALDKCVDLLSKGGILLSGLLLMSMSINIAYGVIKRYVFHSPSIVSIELVKILLIPACVLAVSYVQRYGRHLRVDFISNRFSKTVQYIISEIAVPLMGLAVGYVLVWKGAVAAAYSLQIHETSYSVWSEPLYPVKLMIPIGYGMLCLIMIGQVCRGIGVVATRKRKKQAENQQTTKAV
jgi:TRAP-type mannitol/chloroaromatic compound transport system permease small subunit